MAHSIARLCGTVLWFLAASVYAQFPAPRVLPAPIPGGPIPAPMPAPIPAPAMPAPWGRCDDQVRGQSFAIQENGYTYQIGFPANAGVAARDPSGQTFLRMPAANPMMDAFFVTWNLELVQISTAFAGPRLIGHCMFAVIPAPPPRPFFNAALAKNHGVVYLQGDNGGLIPVPVTVANNSIGFSPPGMTTPAAARECMDQSTNRDEFADCMIPKMLSPAQRKAYACAKKYGKDDDDGVLLSSCLAQTVVGEDEQRYIKQATRCYQKYGQDYDKYPLCMATQNFDEKTATTVSCVTERAKQGQVTGWTIAGCAAGSQLNMNAEATVALQCAMSTGGQPYAFAACTGGQLTVNELTKCFTIGIGGSGCFGDNNTIIKGLRDLGVNVQSVIGPNGFAVQTYNNAVNDIRYGPGANNEVVKAINTVNHDLTHGLGKNNDLRKAAESIGLGGLF